MGSASGGGLSFVRLVLDAQGALRPLVNVYVDGDDAKALGGLEAPLEPDAEVRVVAAIAGGQESWERAFSIVCTPCRRLIALRWSPRQADSASSTSSPCS